MRANVRLICAHDRPAEMCGPQRYLITPPAAAPFNFSTRPTSVPHTCPGGFYLGVFPDRSSTFAASRLSLVPDGPLPYQPRGLQPVCAFLNNPGARRLGRARCRRPPWTHAPRGCRPDRHTSIFPFLPVRRTLHPGGQIHTRRREPLTLGVRPLRTQACGQRSARPPRSAHHPPRRRAQLPLSLRLPPGRSLARPRGSSHTPRRESPTQGVGPNGY